MTREELRERVAMVIADAEYPGLNPVGVHKDMASAAIALVLEEAAKVAMDEYRKSSSGDEIAVAIRALGKA